MWSVSEESKSTILGPEIGYVDILYHEMAEKSKKNAVDPEHKKKYTPLRPSAAGKCSRELYYDYMGYSGKEHFPVEPNKPEVELLLDLGGSVEYHLMKFMKEAMKEWNIKMLYGQQTLSFKKLDQVDDKTLEQWLEGKLDLTFISPNWKCVADIKSKKDKFSNFYKTNWDETDEKLRAMDTVSAISERAYWVEDLEAFLHELDDAFFEANFLQLNMYANSEFLIERGVDHAAIIQYCKNDSRLREVRFKPSKKLYEATIAKFESVQKAVDKQNIELAPKDFTLGSMKCAFCPYKTKCWTKEDPLKEWFGTLPPKRWPTRINRLEEGLYTQLKFAFDEYERADGVSKDLKKIEKDLIKTMKDAKLNTVELDNGNVYKIKALKDSIVIRRTKK